jgi:cell division septation protein DedD
MPRPCACLWYPGVPGTTERRVSRRLVRVMQRILALDDPPPQPAPEPGSGYGFKEDFELVVGRRQVAAFAFLALVLVTVCSGASYLAGKVISTHEEPAQPEIQVELPAPPPAPPPPPMLEATIAREPVAAPLPKPATEGPLFANPNPKATYIQVGAVEKGVAVVIAEGLRRHALDSFVAPGPSTKTYRVLIGPFPDAAAYQRARNVVDQIGLENFVRRYQAQ